MTGRPEPVVVTGLGALSAAGTDSGRGWETVCDPVPTAGPDPALAGLPVDFSCRVPALDVRGLLGGAVAMRTDRFVHLALLAAREAVADAGLDPRSWDGARVGVVIGNSLGGSTTAERQHGELVAAGQEFVSPLTIPMTMVNMVAGYVAIDCDAFGPSLAVATACASGTTALGMGRQLLDAGACDVVLAGGTESALSPLTMAALHRMGALSTRRADPGRASRPFDAGRDGFVAGEGAGMLVLERERDAVARGARRRAVVAGFGSASDAYHATAPDPTGLGLERALRAALTDARVDPDEVDHVNAHGTSTPLNDVTEAAVLSRVIGGRAAVTSTKGVTGHPLAAAGAIEAVWTVLALEQGVVPPTANVETLDPRVELDVVLGKARSTPVRVAISTSLGFGGHNAALVLTAT